MMESEELEPLPDDLFDDSSATHREALDQMREHLLRLGYRVDRRPPRGKTLRVYLDEGMDYPLMNPRITTIPAAIDDAGEPATDGEIPVIAVTVLSKGDSELDERLRAFPNGDGAFYVVNESQGPVQGFIIHGTFVIPLHLRELSGTEVINFPPMVASFRSIRRFLLGDDIVSQHPSR